MNEEGAATPADATERAPERPDVGAPEQAEATRQETVSDAGTATGEEQAAPAGGPTGADRAASDGPGVGDAAENAQTSARGAEDEPTRNATDGAPGSADAAARAETRRKAMDAYGIKADEEEPLFEIYEKSLKTAMWDYKNHVGEDRQLGHASMMNVETAYVMTSLVDEDRADKLYQQYAGRAPSKDLKERAAAQHARDAAGGRGSFAELTSGVESLERNRDGLKHGREHQGLVKERDDLSEKIQRSAVSLGDARERANSHLRKCADGLAHSDKPQDDGLHLVKAMWRGTQAGADLVRSRRLSKQAGQLQTEADKSGAKIKEIETQLQSFVKKDGVVTKLTLGPAGQVAQRFGGAGAIVSAVLNAKRKANVSALNETEQPSRAPSQAARAAQQSQQSQTMGL